MLATPRQTNFRFSSEDFPPWQRRDAICGLGERGILSLDPLEETATAKIAKHFLPGAGILTGTLSGLRQDGTVRSADASDDIFLGVNVSGRSVAIQNGEEIEFGDGDAVYLSCAEGSFAIVRPTPVDFVGIRAPRAAIAPLVRGHDCRMRRVSSGKAALALLSGYANAIPGILAETPDRSAVLANHLYDLMALSLDVGLEAKIDLGRSVRAARLQAIKSDIAARLNDSSLTLAAIVERHRVTARYIHKLFASEGTTFTHYVLRQRLDQAYRLLRDQRYAGRSVSSIAYLVGFNDLSYFNRTFRQHYGATPSDIKNGANHK